MLEEIFLLWFNSINIIIVWITWSLSRLRDFISNWIQSDFKGFFSLLRINMKWDEKRWHSMRLFNKENTRKEDSSMKSNKWGSAEPSCQSNIKVFLES